VKLFSLAALLLFACAASASRADVPFGAAFDLPRGESVAVGGGKVTVRFDAVLNDSRCPVNVQCVWAGNAQLRFVASVPGSAASELMLHTHGGAKYPREACVLDFKVQLVRFVPLPVHGEPRRDETRIATLVVREGCASP
jgi:hypothetical protein